MMPPVHWDTIITGLISAAILAGIRALTKALKDYSDGSQQWRSRMEQKLDTMMGATQTTMRATLIHNYEKYADRGWLTPEERASWCDMHDKYSAMGFNGLIDTYRHKLDKLDDKEI